MNAETTVREYYDALRAGEPLSPYFAPDDDPDESLVKFGISEHLDGYEAVETGLREQTRTTVDWTVDSRDLRVTERDRHAWFADLVSLGWTDTDRGIRFEFETRWSGTLERSRPTNGANDDTYVDGNESPSETDSSREADSPSEAEQPGDWRFVGMHVSTAEEL